MSNFEIFVGMHKYVLNLVNNRSLLLKEKKMNKNSLVKQKVALSSRNKNSAVTTIFKIPIAYMIQCNR